MKKSRKGNIVKTIDYSFSFGYGVYREGSVLLTPGAATVVILTSLDYTVGTDTVYATSFRVMRGQKRFGLSLSL